MTQLELGIDWQEVANVPWADSTGLYFETKDGIQQAGLVPTSRIPIDTTRTGFHNAFPVENLPTMERWRRAMYRQRHLVDKHSYIDAVVLEIPRAPLVATMRQQSLLTFGFVSVLFLAGLGSAGCSVGC